MITLDKIKDNKDGTANYTFNVDDKFIKYYVEVTKQPVEDKLVGEFITKLIYEACGESYTKADRDFVKFKGE
jgi:hypothetical protein